MTCGTPRSLAGFKNASLPAFGFFLGIILPPHLVRQSIQLVRQSLGRQICRFGISFSMAYGESEMVSIRGYRGFFPLALFGVFATVAAATTLSSPRAGVLASRATRKCTRNYSLHKQWLSSQQLRASCGLSRAVLVSTTGGAHFSPGFRFCLNIIRHPILRCPQNAGRRARLLRALVPARNLRTRSRRMTVRRP